MEKYCVKNCEFIKEVGPEYACVFYGKFLFIEKQMLCKCKACIGDGQDWAVSKTLENIKGVFNGSF